MEHRVSQHIVQLLNAHHLLTASELITHLHNQGKKVNKTSVYRALEKLEAGGLICKQNLRDSDLVYELRANHHDHLVCTNCGSVSATECQITVNPQDNFIADHHHLTVFGLCASCAANLSGKSTS